MKYLKVLSGYSRNEAWQDMEHWRSQTVMEERVCKEQDWPLLWSLGLLSPVWEEVCLSPGISEGRF